MGRDITKTEKLIEDITQGVYCLDRQKAKTDQMRFVDKLDDSFEEDVLLGEEITNDEQEGDNKADDTIQLNIIYYNY